MPESHRLIFPDWYDERAEWEHASKGWLQGVIVELGNGSRYPVFFCDPVRLGQDLEAEKKGFIAEVGLIVLPEVSRTAMTQAVARLVEEGFSESQMPLAGSVPANGSVTTKVTR